MKNISVLQNNGFVWICFKRNQNGNSNEMQGDVHYRKIVIRRARAQMNCARKVKYAEDAKVSLNNKTNTNMGVTSEMRAVQTKLTKESLFQILKQRMNQCKTTCMGLR